MSLSLQQQRVLLSLLSGLCFSGSVRRQKVLGKVKGLSWRVFPHSEAHVATGKGLRFLYSKPGVWFLDKVLRTLNSNGDCNLGTFFAGRRHPKDESDSSGYPQEPG